MKLSRPAATTPEVCEGGGYGRVTTKLPKTQRNDKRRLLLDLASDAALARATRAALPARPKLRLKFASPPAVQQPPVDADLALLAQLYPCAFITWPLCSGAPIAPLAINIDKVLVAALGWSRARIRRALRRYASQPGYLRGLAAGRRRRDLDGGEGAKATATERAHARAQLDAWALDH
jgi:hypothetical protein